MVKYKGGKHKWAKGAVVKAVILVGGQATRLLPLTCNTPKAMVPGAQHT
ncbi:unnamed protein product, partial [marine sediment metagenome]